MKSSHPIQKILILKLSMMNVNPKTHNNGKQFPVDKPIVQQLLGKDLTWYVNEGVKLVERVTKHLRSCTTKQKMTYLNVLGDLGTQVII